MTDPTAKRGRPTAGRTALLKLRVTPDEHARYLAAAKSVGVPLSEWAREGLEAFAADEPTRRAKG